MSNVFDDVSVHINDLNNAFMHWCGTSVGRNVYKNNPELYTAVEELAQRLEFEYLRVCKLERRDKDLLRGMRRVLKNVNSEDITEVFGAVKQAYDNLCAYIESKKTVWEMPEC